MAAAPVAHQVRHLLRLFGSEEPAALEVTGELHNI
jgi:hypothetical protein